MSISHVYVAGPELLFGVGRVESTNGLMRGSMSCGPTLVGPDGRTSMGALGVLVDDVLGYSIIDSLADDVWSVSTEIWVHLLAPLPNDGGRVHADAHVVAAGSFSAGSLVDDHGNQLAAFSQRGRAAGPPLDSGDLPVVDLPSDALDVADLLGLETDGDALAMAVTPALENPRRMLHGGISLCASEVAATRSRVLAGSDLATSSLHIVHSRGIPAGSVVEFRTTTRHAGRSLWVSDVTGYVEGKACTIARVSAEA